MSVPSELQAIDEGDQRTVEAGLMRGCPQRTRNTLPPGFLRCDVGVLDDLAAVVEDETAAQSSQEGQERSHEE
jgi:hypothetical protein